MVFVCEVAEQLHFTISQNNCMVKTMASSTDYYHNVDAQPGGYNLAEKTCNNQGRYLASIESSSQNRKVIESCQVIINIIYEPSQMIS